MSSETFRNTPTCPLSEVSWDPRGFPTPHPEVVSEVVSELFIPTKLTPLLIVTALEGTTSGAWASTCFLVSSERKRMNFFYEHHMGTYNQFATFQLANEK